MGPTGAEKLSFEKLCKSFGEIRKLGYRKDSYSENLCTTKNLGVPKKM